MQCGDPGLREPALLSGLSRKQLKEAVKSRRMLQSTLKGFAILATEDQTNGGILRFWVERRVAEF
jgi:hypothetical protein